VLLAINLSRCGESGPGGCFEDLASADVAACVSAVKKFRSHIWGIAVNTSHHACGRTDPKEVLRRGLAAAEETGLPVLYGMRRPEDWPLKEQLCQLRPGDVVTYCFRRTPHCIVHEGRLLDAVLEARNRGILFDVGHGTTSFDFVTAETALNQGFPPDTISTDLQRNHIARQPIHDLPLVMSKLRAAGMAEKEVIRAVTFRPAQILGLEQEIGSLAIGSRADLVLLHWSDSTEPLVDAHENARAGGQWTAAITIRGGKPIDFAPQL
jgi:dihydroorotase